MLAKAFEEQPRSVHVRQRERINHLGLIIRFILQQGKAGFFENRYKNFLTTVRKDGCHDPGERKKNKKTFCSSP